MFNNGREHVEVLFVLEGVRSLILVYVNLLAWQDCGGFFLSCDDFKVSSDGTFAADCLNTPGNVVHTTIDLDDYIANYQGNFGYGQGFAYSCQDLGTGGAGDPLSEVWLQGNCWDSQGNLVATRMDLTYRLANSNGTLCWTVC